MTETADLQEAPALSAAEFRQSLEELEMTQRDFARVYRLNERTVRRWAAGSAEIAGWVRQAIVDRRAQQRRRGKAKA